mgnify:FL=1
MIITRSLDLSLILAATLLATSAFAQDNPSLEVIVSGAVADKGQVIISVFDSPDAHLKAPIVELRDPVDGTGIAPFVVKDLARGRYSVSAVYDLDSSGELNTGLFGIPTEPVGFSSNAKGMFGPPGFDDTSFLFDKDMKVEIVLTNVSN